MDANLIWEQDRNNNIYKTLLLMEEVVEKRSSYKSLARRKKHAISIPSVQADKPIEKEGMRDEKLDTSKTQIRDDGEDEDDGVTDDGAMAGNSPEGQQYYGAVAQIGQKKSDKHKKRSVSQYHTLQKKEQDVATITHIRR